MAIENESNIIVLPGLLNKDYSSAANPDSQEPIITPKQKRDRLKDSMTDESYAEFIENQALSFLHHDCNRAADMTHQGYEFEYQFGMFAWHAAGLRQKNSYPWAIDVVKRMDKAFKEGFLQGFKPKQVSQEITLFDIVGSLNGLEEMAESYRDYIRD